MHYICGLKTPKTKSLLNQKYLSALGNIIFFKMQL